MRVTTLAGGTGSVKLVRGLYSVLNEKLDVVVNVADNFWIHGLYVCPDLDTIVYGLAGVLSKERGWGIQDDTFNMLNQLAKFDAETWFRLGDKDLALHIRRTERLRKNSNLSQITSEISQALGVRAKVMPATDTHVETRIFTERGEMHLQEFWVKEDAHDKVYKVLYRNIRDARPTKSVKESIASSDLIIICPGNPITSIRPILKIPGLLHSLRETSATVIGVSPIIGESAVSGPAGTLMKALGLDVSPLGVLKLYRGLVDEFVIDSSDSSLANKVKELGVKPRVTNILMRIEEDEIGLAQQLIQN